MKQVAAVDRSHRINCNNRHILMQLSLGNEDNIMLLPELGLNLEFVLQGMDKSDVLHNKKDYCAVWIHGNRERYAVMQLYHFVYISYGSRPSMAHMKRHFMAILKNEFPGEYTASHGKYLFKFNYCHKTVIEAILTTAKAGDGSVVDYSWIAPMQELMECFKERDTKRWVKPSLQSRYKAPPKLSLSSAPATKRIDPLPWQHDTTVHVSNMAKTVLDKIVRNTAIPEEVKKKSKDAYDKWYESSMYGLLDEVDEVGSGIVIDTDVSMGQTSPETQDGNL